MALRPNLLVTVYINTLYLIDIGVFMLTFLEKETKKDPLDI